jgi:hypothetical protein
MDSVKKLETNDQYISTIHKIINKYNIKEDTAHNDIKIYILKYISDNIFESFLQDEIIIKDYNLYIYGNYLLNKSDIIKYILSNSTYKNKLKLLICFMYKNIIKTFKIEKNKILKSTNNIQLMKIEKKIKKMVEKKKNFSELIDRKNSRDLETSYKQTRIEMEMNNQIHQLNNQRVNQGIEYIFNQQQYETEIDIKQSLILKRNDQIQTLNNQLLMNRHYIENLEFDISKKIIQHNDEKYMIDIYKKTNKLQIDLINESIELRKTINDSFVKMINAMREDSEAIIKTIAQTSQLTRETIVESTNATTKALVETSEKTQKTIQQQSILFQQAIRKNAQELQQQLIKIHGVIQEGNRLKLLLHDKIKQIFAKIGTLETELYQTSTRVDMLWRAVFIR